ncbi:MAG: hypothetical protein ABIR79_01035 [Candidatus Binatia bacterium]
MLALLAMGSDLTRPLGIVLGGTAAWLDFVVLRSLGSAMLSKRPAIAHLVPMALAKSFILITVPALALLLPTSLVDGVSFALGVTALPASIVIDALLPIASDAKTGEL